MPDPRSSQRRSGNLWDAEHGCCVPGVYDKGQHIGRPLTVDEIKALPDDAEVTISWDGGNGPHPYRVKVDEYGTRRLDNLYGDPILIWDDQTVPIHRVTLGWCEEFRERRAEREAL